MSRLIPFLSETAIERDAMALLTEYAHDRGVAIAPPIPIEDIIEKHLKIRLEFNDTHELFGIRRGPSATLTSSARFFSTNAGL
jgi:hypothetical protein